MSDWHKTAELKPPLDQPVIGCWPERAAWVIRRFYRWYLVGAKPSNTSAPTYWIEPPNEQ